MAEQVLKMEFKNAAGGKMTITVDNPKATLTPAEVTQAMNDIIAQNIFTSTGGDLVEALGAIIVSENPIV